MPAIIVYTHVYTTAAEVKTQYPSPQSSPLFSCWEGGVDAPFHQEKVMPRLQGKSSSAPAALTVMLVLVAAFLVLEYFGVINVIPNFGRP